MAMVGLILLIAVLFPVMCVLVFRKAGFRGATQWLGALPVLGWVAVLLAENAVLNMAENENMDMQLLFTLTYDLLVPILTLAPLVILWRLDWPIRKQETTPMEGV